MSLPLARCTCPGWCNAELHAAGLSSYGHVERMAELQAENDSLRDRLALMTERWLRAEEDAERLAAELCRTTRILNGEVVLSQAALVGQVGMNEDTLDAHDDRKAEEA